MRLEMFGLTVLAGRDRSQERELMGWYRKATMTLKNIRADGRRRPDDGKAAEVADNTLMELGFD